MDDEMDNQPDDPPVRQLLKVVYVLDVIPGNADRENGEPIVIVTLGHKGEVEQPLMLLTREAKKLTRAILVALTDHGDPLAEEVIKDHLTSEWQATPITQDHPTKPLPTKLTKRLLPSLIGLSVIGVRISVRHNRGGEPEDADLYGAYSLGRQKYFLVRFVEKRPANCSSVINQVVKLGLKNTVQIGSFPEDERLPKEEWVRFGQLPEGTQFRFKNKTWTKMTQKQLQRLLAGRIFDAR